MTDITLQVIAPNFVAGLILDPVSYRCIAAAPILHWAVGKGAVELHAYFAKQGWKALVVPPA